MLGIGATRFGFTGFSVEPLLNHQCRSFRRCRARKRHFAICYRTIGNRRGVALRQILTEFPVVVRFMSVEHQSYFSSSKV